MSYEKAMRHTRNPKKRRPQPMGFSTLESNERHCTPWLGSMWFEPGMDEERTAYIKAYREETERMLKENPNLKLVD